MSRCARSRRCASGGILSENGERRFQASPSGDRYPAVGRGEAGGREHGQPDPGTAGLWGAGLGHCRGAVSTLSRLNDSRADDLAAYADAVWWLGRIEDNLRLSAAAYNAFLADSRPAEAALTATVLGIFHTGAGRRAAGCGLVGPRWPAGRGRAGVHGARVPAELHRRRGESHGRPTGRGGGRGSSGAGPRPPDRRARSGRGGPQRRGPRPDQVRPPGRGAGAPR